MTPKKAARRLEWIHEVFTEKVGALARDVREQKVIPVCRKYKLNFRSGNGTYFFYAEDGKSYPAWDPTPMDKVLAPLFEFLDLEVDYTHTLGDFVRDVDWKEES